MLIYMHLWPRVQKDKKTKRTTKGQGTKNRIHLVTHTILLMGNQRRWAWSSLLLLSNNIWGGGAGTEQHRNPWPHCFFSPDFLALKPGHGFLTLYQPAFFLPSYWHRIQANKLCELITLQVNYILFGLKQKFGIYRLWKLKGQAA